MNDSAVLQKLTCGNLNHIQL